MTRSRRFDPVRYAAGGRGLSDISNELNSIRTSGSPGGPFTRGIVYEVLSDPSRFTD